MGGKSDPPPAPDYRGAAKEQGASNLESTIAGAKLNNPNVINPYGSQTVTYGGEGGLTPTIRQTLSPDQQAIFDKQNQSKLSLGDLSLQGTNSLKGVVGKSVDFSGAPAAPGSYDQTRKKVIDAMMGRTNEDYAQQSDQLNSDLVARGISPGTKAYADAQQKIERSRNDARQQAEIAGGNTASQAYGLDEQSRKNYISELLAKRQVPLNEITALMSGSQVSNPFAVPGYSQNAQLAPAPMFGAATSAGQYGTDVYNAEVSGKNGLLSAGAQGLGAAASIYFL